MQQTIDRRVGAKNIPVVAENVAAMKTIRNFSRKSLEKKSEKEMSALEAQKQLIEEQIEKTRKEFENCGFNMETIEKDIENLEYVINKNLREIEDILKINF